MKFIDTIREEQETQINISYSEKEVEIYTSRKVVLNKLIKKLGQPSKIFYYKDKFITGARWILKFTDKNCARIFSKCMLIGNIK